MPTTKLFKKCTIIANNPVHRELFLVRKRVYLYCINIKNKSIMKVDFQELMYEAQVRYSSNGDYFVIVHLTEINVFNSKTLAFIRTFLLINPAMGISNIINTEGTTIDIDTLNNIDDIRIEQFVLYNEYLVCIVNYMSEPYRRHHYDYDLINIGVEVYNIMTGELVTNNFNLPLTKIYLTNNSIHCCIFDNPFKIYQLTPQLDLTELPSDCFINILNYKYHFNNDIIGFLFDNDNENCLHSYIINFDNSTRLFTHTRIQLDFNPKSILYNMIYTPDNNFFLVGLSMYKFTRILVFNSSISKCLFYVDIPSVKYFYVLDDYRIVYGYEGSVYIIETHLTKTLHTQKLTLKSREYYLPDELWNKILLSF